MCFAKENPHKTELKAKFDEQNGEIVDDSANESPNPLLLDLPEHVDNPFVHKEIEHGILGHIYETKDQIITVWNNCNDSEICLEAV